MKLSALLAQVDALDVVGSTDRDVLAVTRDSRTAGPGHLFVALSGTRFDGHDFVSSLDAAAVVVEREVQTRPGVTSVLVADSRIALAQLAAAMHRHPARTVQVVGVTGTNGKTTVTTLVDEALRHAGVRSGRIGTTGTYAEGRPVPSDLTTPMADDLQRLLADMRDAGITACSIEVSSIGLDQYRVGGIDFHTAVFTNLGRDHLDYHGTVEAYTEAKSALFKNCLREAGGPPRALLCADDPAWPALGAPADRWLYGFAAEADLRVTDLDVSATGMRVAVSTPMGPATIHTPLLGRYNAQNLAAAVGVCLCLGLSAGAAAEALGLVQGVSGRLEPVPNERGLVVVVDYAHTPDALVAVLTAVKGIVDGAVWCVFGCGGDRDAAKRPQMGRAVAQHADHVVVTSDNPRDEDPLLIIEAILLGMDAPPAHVSADRRAAIHWTMASARAGDAVVIAGKGHETTQEVRGVKLPFDDRIVARHALEALS